MTIGRKWILTSIRANSANCDDVAMFDRSFSRTSRHSMTRRRLLVVGAGVTVGALSALPRPASAARITVTSPNIQPMPIALPDFFAGSEADRNLAVNITQIISGNLRRSGLFAPID